MISFSWKTSRSRVRVFSSQCVQAAEEIQVEHSRLEFSENQDYARFRRLNQEFADGTPKDIIVEYVFMCSWQFLPLHCNFFLKNLCNSSKKMVKTFKKDLLHFLYYLMKSELSFSIPSDP